MEQEPKVHFKFKKQYHIARPLSAAEILAGYNLTIGDLRSADVALNGERLQTLNIRGRSRQRATLENITEFLTVSPGAKK